MNTFDYVDLDGDIRYIKDSAGRAMLAPEETSTTASITYSIGDLFRYDGKLYRATATISQNGTITIGTNCEETTIENELDKKISKPVGIPADKFLKTDSNGESVWGDGITAAQISAATDAWLNQNVTNPASPPLDDSLTLANAAAPADKVGELKEAMLDSGIAMPINEGWITGKRMGTPAVGENFTDNPGTISAWQYIKLSCSPGDSFIINAVGTSTFRPWAFADATLKCLSRNVLVNNTAVAENELITAPEDAAWLYINQNADRGDCYSGFIVKKQIKNLEQTVGNIETLTEENTEAIQDMQSEIEKALSYKGVAKSADYSQLLSNIVEQGIYYLNRQAATGDTGIFNDRPIDSTGVSAILLVYPVLNTYVLQNLLDIYGNNFFRYIDISSKQPYIPTRLVADENGWFLPNHLQTAITDIATLTSRQRWAGKTIVFFGDSRTWYDGQQYSDNTKTGSKGNTCVGYQQQCVNLLGITAINQGDSGKNTAEISQNIISYGTNFANVDAVYISGGVNDFVLSRSQVGALDTEGGPYDTNTAYGGLQTAIEWLLTNYPKLKIFIEVPPIAWRGENNDVYPYETACLKKNIAEFYNLPYVDLYKNSGINIINRSEFYADDPSKTNNWYLHFNDYGNERIGQIVAEFINTH